MGLLLLASGPLYSALGGGGFFVMAGVSAAALLLIWPFARQVEVGSSRP